MASFKLSIIEFMRCDSLSRACTYFLSSQHLNPPLRRGSKPSRVVVIVVIPSLDGRLKLPRDAHRAATKLSWKHVCSALRPLHADEQISRSFHEYLKASEIGRQRDRKGSASRLRRKLLDRILHAFRSELLQISPQSCKTAIVKYRKCDKFFRRSLPFSLTCHIK